MILFVFFFGGTNFSFGVFFTIPTCLCFCITVWCSLLGAFPNYSERSVVVRGPKFLQQR
jgi:hypothetical protein